MKAQILKRLIPSGVLALCMLFLCLLATAAPPLPTGHPRLQITTDQPAPVIVHVGAVDHSILALEIESQRTKRSAVKPYMPLPGDKTKVKEEHGIVKSVELVRDGKRVGYLAGPKRSHVCFFEELVGDVLNEQKADDPATYTLLAPRSSQTHTPICVWRKSKPIDIALPASEFPKRHYIYLQLPVRLKIGQEYTLRMPELGLKKKELSFAFDPLSNRSEAIHVSHIGFRPDDPAKHAHLSVWLGTGGAHRFDRDLRFVLVDDATSAVVHRGTIKTVWPAERPETMKREQNHSLTDVALLDFSDFSKPGSYRICVEGIGCSYPFTIGPDVWDEPFLTAMKGFYHQRSGVALGPPYSDFSRPRPYHPDDGLKVFVSDVTLMETRNGLNFLGDSNNFEALNKNVTDVTVENAWGGYFDAADWDRRIQHLSSSRSHLELLELFPSYFKSLTLNIPESDDAVPDILDEALFNIDCYRRLQTPEGGIRGGVEASEHPVKGETSWLESLRVMAYAPGPWSSYIYTNVAARAACLLRPFDSERASGLGQSALRAWAWAESNKKDYETRYGQHPRWNKIIDERNLAALELLRLTGDQKWHEHFAEDSVLTESKGTTDRSQIGRQRDAAFLYARLPDSLSEPRMATAARQSILNDAKSAMVFARENAWGFASSNRFRATGTGWFSTPDLIPLMRAHFLSGRPEFKAAFVRGVLFSVGANPMNITYTTGVGHEWPRNAMVLDSRRTARAVPEGITVFGQVDYPDAQARRSKWQLGALDWYLVRKKAIYPEPFAWPVNESYWDIHQWPAACEFTPQSTMGDVSYMWGYLAAHGNPKE